MEGKDIEQPITQTDSYASRTDAMKEKLSVLALLEHIMVVGEITKLTEREKSEEMTLSLRPAGWPVVQEENIEGTGNKS